jgi:endonuclease YncB( thermonuclease family)
MDQRRYPTGADVTAYMTSGRTLPVPASGAGLSGPVGQIQALRSPTFEELDIAHVTIVQDGQATPLYEFTDRLAGEFMYSRSMVNVELQFNYSEQFSLKRRVPQIQQIRGNTLWLLLEKAQWWPEPAVVRDLVRIDEVYEHSFRHEPAPSASEQVPCTARGLTLVGRREQGIDTEPIARSIESGDTPDVPDAFQSDRSRYLGKVVEVTDGDTLKVKMEATGETVDVRLVGVDTPETADSPRLNRAGWTWPPEAGPNTGRGTPSESPSPQQLVGWGEYAKRRAKEVFNTKNDGEGRAVWLVSDPGAAPVDDAEINPTSDDGRFLFQVKPTVPLELPGGETERDYGAWLLKRGLARHVDTTSIGAGRESRSAQLKRIYREARQQAGSSDAKGIWYAFDVEDWKPENQLAP